MGWASDAFWRDLYNAGVRPAVRKTSSTNTKEKDMSKYHDISKTNDLVRVCDNRHILGETEKAIRVRIGQTLYGEPITTFYPKSLCKIRYREDGGYDVFVPKWVNRNRSCLVGDFEVRPSPDLCDLPF